jgi:hypothetical protein
VRSGPTGQVRVEVAPAAALIERRDGTQLVNCDLVVTNAGTDRLRLWEIELSVFDSTGRLVQRKTVNANGFAPAITMVAPPILEPKATIDIFNPFYAFDVGTPLARLHFALRYLVENNATDSTRNQERMPFDFDVEGQVDVAPHAYAGKTSLILPLRGRLLVWDGHDFFSHHRRVPLHDRRVVQAGIGANPSRYALDLIAVDSQGHAYRGSPYDKEHWFTYGMPIFAPGAGRVIASASSIPDNWFERTRLRAPDLPDSDLVVGNFVVIDHGDGEYSVLPHMEAGSVRVHAGDLVRQGQILGQVGFSGDAIFPHVHYSLISTPRLMSADGLPISFHNFRRVRGSVTKTDADGAVDSGDLIESTK